jgi:hypothetical protein
VIYCVFVESPSVKQTEASVHELELKLERLRVFYEQYFLGIMKREPLVQLKEIVRLIRVLDTQQIRNTALRFRFRATLQKFNSYRSYWRRTVRQMEAGTHRRDVARVKRNFAKRGIMLPDLKDLRTAADIERALVAATPKDQADAAPTTRAPEPRAATTTTTTAAGPPAGHPPAAKPEALPEDQLQSLYRRFVKAKKMCGEDTQSIRYDMLVRTINRQLPKLRKQHGGREIEFQVVIKRGRTILKAIPK